MLSSGDGATETIDPRSLKNLPRLLRNSIAHFNIRPIGVDGRFGGIRIWNRNPKGQITFVADLDFDAFRPLAEHSSIACTIVKDLNSLIHPIPLMNS